MHLLTSTLATLGITLPVQDWIEADLLTSGSLKWSQAHGSAVAVCGDLAVVGAPDESSSFLASPGKAHVYQRVLGKWSRTDELQAPLPADGDAFGGAVALSGDTLVVGAQYPDGGPTIGQAFVFERDQVTGDWSATTLVPSDDITGDRYGIAVAINGDTAVVGAPFFTAGGTAFVFERNAGGPGSWSQTTKLTGSDTLSGDNFGHAVTVWGDTLVVGAPNDLHPSIVKAGSAYVFAHSNGAWNEVTKLISSDPIASDAFGAALALHSDTLAVGAFDHPHPGLPIAGSAYVFERDQGGPDNWGEVAELLPTDGENGDDFGSSIDVAGELLLVGAMLDSHPGASQGGSAYSFGRDVGGAENWGLIEKLVAEDTAIGHEFGSRVALSGGTAFVGAPGHDLGYQTFDLYGLAYDPASGVMYGVEAFDELLTIDLSTGLGTSVGPLGFIGVHGLAFDSSSGTLIGSDITTDQLLSIDTATGGATPIGPLGFAQVRGLAYDPLSSTLYGVDAVTNQLLQVDRATGSATAIGNIGFTGVQGLAFDPVTGRLYGSDKNINQLVTIDPQTGAGTAVGPFSFLGMVGLAFDPNGGELYGVANSWLYDINESSGLATIIGTAYIDRAGAAYVFELPPQAYCTAGLSENGCQALLSASGYASASVSTGFTLSANGVEGGRPGLFFFGTNGRQANPWGNGSSFQCVVPPVVRTPLMAGAGTQGLCDGAFAQDLNAWWCPSCPKSSKNPGAGAVVQAQLWYRDPLNTSNQSTSMSDALEFLVEP